MKTSELIQKLQKAMEMAGDKEVRIYSDGQGPEVGGVVVGIDRIAVCDDYDILNVAKDETKIE